MRITKKIAAGFGVLLMLVLLVGLAAVRTLDSIEQVNSRVLEEFPVLTEKVMDVRRHLMVGLKGSTSYFLTGQEVYWTEGQLGIAEARATLMDLLKNLEEFNYGQEHKAEFMLLRDELANFTTLAQQAKTAETEHRILIRATVNQGNLATELALRYQSNVMARLLAYKGNNPEVSERLRNLLQQAQALTTAVAQTRARATMGYLQKDSTLPEVNKEVVSKDLALLGPMQKMEKDEAARHLLTQLENALLQRSQFSDKWQAFYQKLNEIAIRLTQVEGLLLDSSYTLVNSVRDRSMRTLAEQNQRTHTTSTTLLIFLGCILAFGIIFAMLLMRHIKAALNRSLDFAESVIGGELDQRLPVGRNDEMGLMAQAMNSMLDTLHQKIAEAQQKEHEAIDARRQAEEARAQSEEANRAKEDFLARMSHEVRTPMNAIIGLGHLCQQTRLDEQQTQYIIKILRSANDLLGILNEILDFSKIEGGKLELSCLPFHLSVVMDNLARIMRQRSQHKSVTFTCQLDPDIPPVLLGDPLRLTQVLINLAGNGVKFTDQGAVTIEVQCVRRNHPELELQFSITDTGIGMSDEQYSHVFQPFVQGDGSNTRRFGGTGLGLSISQRLVALMGGSMEAEANPLGGSIFRFTIPLHVSEGGFMAASPLLENLRALVVDDSPLSQQVTASNLVSLGIHVNEVDSGEQALEEIVAADAGDTPYSLIILDWRMPDMDGIETARRIGQLTLRHSPPALLMHSDYSLDEMLQLASEVGITAFLPKPGTPASFQKIILETLGGDISEMEENARTSASMAMADGTSRILLVEDNEINQEIARELLKIAQLEVDTVNNGQEAVEAVEKQAYALIFMDVQMPVMDGLEATRRIRAAGHRMPIVAMTAHAMRGDKEISLAAGMNDHLTKPLDPEAIYAALNVWLHLSPPTVASESKPSSDVPLQERPFPTAIDGFNLSAGLAAVGGNEKLYAGLLSKFAARYATITEDITACLQKNDLETAVRLAHTVKGIAANLGAEALAEAAGALEKTITHDPSMTTPHLKTLVLRLADAVTAVWTALGYKGAHNDESPKDAVASRLSNEMMETLCTKLEAAIANMEMDWAAATSVAQEVLECLRGTELEEQAAALSQAVEDFETPTALDISQQLQATLRFACSPSKAE